MTGIRFTYLPVARDDLMEAVSYFTDNLDAPKAASDLLDELDKTVNQLAQFPYAQELYRTDRPMKDEIRKVPIINFVLYYAVFSDRIEIRRFLHGKRDRSKEI